MEQRIYTGGVGLERLAEHLLDTWDRDETAAQALESDEGLIVQVGRRGGGLFSDAPRSAVTLALEELPDGLRVTQGDQRWYSDGGGRIMVGGLIGFLPFFFTWPLGGGDDAPADPELAERVWESVERFAAQQGAAAPAARAPREAAVGETIRLPQQAGPATGETTRLPAVACPTCGAGNPPAAERCRECGTFLQARACPQCGVSNPATANFCMRCGTSLRA
jgi:ribosomal protein L40E